MNQINSEQLLEQLIEEVVLCKNIESAKDVLYSVAKPTGMLLKAVDYCVRLHDGQFRKSGEPYAIHPILVCSFVAHMGADESMLIASLLHDVVEDTECSEDEIKFEFGQEVMNLVRGLTKIVAIRENELVSSSSNEKLAASALTFRKMLLVSIEDVRVLVIKLCDRLHNMLTLGALRPDKQKRIAEETLVVYAPIAHRLGISSLKNILEDLSFKYVLPNEYAVIDSYINEHKQQLQLKINSFSQKVSEKLLTNGFTEDSFEIQKRIKHYYSIYLKMQRKGISMEEVLDLLAVRILVQNPKDCYLALGILHINFNPLISRFKDYVALPKQNGYQTIHTTIFDNKAIIEAQIRTFDMHKTAEYGVAAHWKYKSGGLISPKLDWLSDISSVESEERSVEDLYEYAKDSLYVEDIAVYSPKGGIFTLPRGATALDYAYEIHSEVGLHAKEAYVNRVRVPLLTELKNGDIVRIVTGDEAHYRCSWLTSVKTGKARATIRNFCRQKIRDINYQVAVDILVGIFNVQESKILNWLEKENLSKKISRAATDSVYLQDVVNALKKYPKEDKLFGLGFANKYEVKKQKFDNIVVYSNHKINAVEFDYCCNPKRGDDIIGFRSGHNVVVHHKLCERAAKFMENKDEMIFVKWTRNAPHRYKVILSIENKRGSLAAFLTYLAKLNVDLVTITLNESDDSVAGDYFDVTIELNENLDSNAIRDRLKERYKIVEFKSLSDAYHNQGE
ncbi:bifunctional (p)ppGpp synthetase/guanosine-3',5'-bis(diphosphate) 3'-pyrophosphohydrolase [Campylobacter hyointestinalis subsp. lawsonii]|uniref:Bifunctional (P)ppGpp synthetase/guanosine-3',5'-bis(Diphosphate) 3'-pyrophosphohydrolase n=3 Tax=Campylobacter hyointestinalis TaxID=198 RepID=A0AAV6EH11_CAMHY|nr:RelA/SpoT family protein [Campylobacter hyointestinalis]ANE33957.1 ppGpp synthetase/guanosine-3',5'-bis(diphosphate) 3' pyrophosphohydrolase [Campylobacter hyointestinalis subsp. lawsonii CCUG 27631]KAB0614119.1 bifunctional (p)ppGpp synthetase/guanosine-3',5'-bis(diphosphate) 3'-pyrophosphohydrolase [Campylobacter hyointestinalis subsp. lawsonii]QKF69858.1 ppGpp synthetase / guanosine-3',5'-bis(diphosphate) 3' pyrophosphohydrolase [Campylobacter hyointestinalis subsp. lawsonii]RAZ25844.1 bi